MKYVVWFDPEAVEADSPQEAEEIARSTFPPPVSINRVEQVPEPHVG